MSEPFVDLGFARVDTDRKRRCGFPEVILRRSRRCRQAGDAVAGIAVQDPTSRSRNQAASTTSFNAPAATASTVRTASIGSNRSR